MTFLHPSLALAGFACIAIPIAVHLLMRRRRKPIMWGAMRFLMEAYRRHRRRLMIERWLLLALRCLLVALLAGAIGRPIIGAMLNAGGTRRYVFILIDNSVAATVRAPDGSTSLDRHKEEARRMLDSLQGGSSLESVHAALICLGEPALGVVAAPTPDLAGLSDVIAGLAPTDSAADVSGAVRQVGEVVADLSESGTDGRDVASRCTVLLLSDFLAGTVGQETPVSALPKGVTLLVERPLGARAAEMASAAPGNIAVTAVEPMRSVVVTTAGPATSSGGSVETVGEQITVRLRRSGAATAPAGRTIVRSTMTREGAPRADDTADAPARAAVNWGPGQETAVASMQVIARAGAKTTEPGATLIVDVSLEADPSNAVEADDHWRRPIEVRGSLRVGVLAPRVFAAESADKLGSAEWLRLALSPTDDWGVEVVEIEPGALDAARLSGLDALILPRPELVPGADQGAAGAPATSGWARLRLFVESGGLLVVMPPADVSVHLWPDAMIKEFGLHWTLAREARPAPATATPPAIRLAPENNDGDAMPSLLTLIAGEFDQLAGPVGVIKYLPMDGELRAEGRPMLALADGSPLAWSGTLGTTGPGHELREQRGLLVYLALPMDLLWTDLPSKPLMVPLMQEIIRQGVGQAHGEWWTVAGRPVRVPRRCVELRAETPGSDPSEAVVPIAEDGGPSTALRHTGVWKAIDDRGGEVGLIAINANPAGSTTDLVSAERVEAWLRRAVGEGPDGSEAAADGGASPESPGLERASSARFAWLGDGVGAPVAAGTGAIGDQAARLIRGGTKTESWSMPLLFAALAFGLAEMLVARWTSHATVGGAR